MTEWWCGWLWGFGWCTVTVLIVVFDRWATTRIEWWWNRLP